VQRIDHGVQAIQDSHLLRRLVRDRIPLTTCPLSNIKLRVFPSLPYHPLKQLLDAGAIVTINSDDPAYFGGYVYTNYLLTFEALGLGPKDAYVLARNSIEGSFVDPWQKEEWYAQLDECFMRFGATVVTTTTTSTTASSS